MVIEVLNLMEAEWEGLSVKERIARYREFADEFEKLKLLEMAAKWRELAADIEATNSNKDTAEG